MDVSELLIFAVENHASDVHLSAGEPPLLRIHGEMRKIEAPALDAEAIHRMIYDILSDEQRKTFEEHLELDFSLSLGDYGRFRVNVFKQNRGDAAAFRPVPNRIPTFEELHLPEIIKRISLEYCDKCLLPFVPRTGANGSMYAVCMAAPVGGALTKAEFRSYPCQPVTGSPAHDAGKGVHAQHASQLPHSGVRLVMNRKGLLTQWL